MTFREVELSLPNGFHDGAIKDVHVDFVNRSILIKMVLHAGAPGEADPERRRPGTLKVVSPYLFFIEPPDPDYPFIPGGSAFNVDGDSVRPGQNPVVDRLLAVLPKDATAYRFFLEEWNSFLYLAGAAVEFSWDDD